MKSSFYGRAYDQVQQMKSQKRDEEALRAKEKEALAKESAARCDNCQP